MIRASLLVEAYQDRYSQNIGRSHEPSHSDFKRIIEYVLDIPEEYRKIGLTTVAEHFVNGMELHLLALMTMFQEKAESEGISLEERRATLNYVLPKAFQTLEALSKQISVKSLDELVALNNITIALYTLSNAETAEEAQKWLYELPTTYSRKLRQASLLPSEQHNDKETNSRSAASNTQFVKWQSSYIPSENQVVQKIGDTDIFVSTPAAPLSEPITVSIETSDQNLITAA